MAGHSKWANIKHRKGTQDAKKNKIYQKIIKEIQVAIKSGGPFPESNPTLRMVIEKAKSVNMPKDNIQRALDRVTQEKDVSDLSEIIYEGYGPGGVAIMVKCLTNNITRTASSIRASFNKAGGNLGTARSVAYLFKTKGILVLDNYEEEKLLIDVIDAGANDVRLEDGFAIIETTKDKFLTIKKDLEKRGYKDFVQAKVSLIPETTSKLDEATTKKVEKLLEQLEDNDDVVEVSHNME